MGWRSGDGLGVDGCGVCHCWIYVWYQVSCTSTDCQFERRSTHVRLRTGTLPFGLVMMCSVQSGVECACYREGLVLRDSITIAVVYYLMHLRCLGGCL